MPWACRNCGAPGPVPVAGGDEYCSRCLAERLARAEAPCPGCLGTGAREKIGRGPMILVCPACAARAERLGIARGNPLRAIRILRWGKTHGS